MLRTNLLPTPGRPRHLVIVASALALLTSGCFEPRAKYHRTDYKFSWQQEDADAERRSGLVYTQPPKDAPTQD